MDDVVVIGAGPAGSTAAWRLAESGLKVLVIEAKAIPRIKPCGGALTSRALDLLPEGFSSYAKSHPTQWTFSNARRHVTITSSTPYCHTVERQYFDQWLIQHAVSRSARLIESSPVTQIEPIAQGYQVTTESGAQYSARYLIGADGGRGVSARLLGLPRAQNGAAMEVELEVPESLYNKFSSRVEVDIAQYPWGYAWVIPRYPILNIGVGSFRPKKLALKSLLDDYLNSKLGDFRPGSPIKPLAHPLPYRTRLGPLARGRALVVGDAAGLMDAFSAEGIYSALRTGHLAANTILSATNGNLPLDTYNLMIQAEFWPNLRSAVKMAFLFYPLAKFWSEIFFNDTHLLERYLQVAQGTTTYQQLLRDTEMSLLNHAKIRWPNPRTSE